MAVSQVAKLAVDPAPAPASTRGAGGIRGCRLLGDAEYHHGCGVHPADEDPGEPGGLDRWSVAHHRQGAANARSLALHNGPRALRVGVRKTGAILRIAPTSASMPSHSPYKLITARW